VCGYIGLLAAKAGSVRFIGRSAIDKPAEVPVSGGRVFFESLTMPFFSRRFAKS
jgi:hypothetical protein